MALDKHTLSTASNVGFNPTVGRFRVSVMRQRGRLSAVLVWNPFHSVLELFRKPLLDGELPSAFNLGMSLALTGIAASIAWFLLRRLERTLVFWL